MITFKNGLPAKAYYRKFKIQNAKNDDYLAIKEVIRRRYFGSLSKTLEFPDLIVIDGGQGQLNAATSILKTATIISLAKKFEEIYIPKKEEPLRIDKKNKGLQLLQAARDESHRFAITYQRTLRNKTALGK